MEAFDNSIRSNSDKKSERSSIHAATRGVYYSVRTYRFAQRKSAEYRAAVADVVYRGIIDVLKAPDGDRFIVIGEHSPDNLIYDRHFLGWDRSSDFIFIQVTSTVGNDKVSKPAFFRYIADELKNKTARIGHSAMASLGFKSLNPRPACG